MKDRTITYPADVVRRIASQLIDDGWALSEEQAHEVALDFVLDCTEAVDKLRAIEAREAGS